jgi:Domain of unknown function (DUF4372)
MEIRVGAGGVYLPHDRDKKRSKPTPTRSKFSVFRQLCNLTPPHLVPQLARDTGVEGIARSFKPWSHVVSLLYAQFTKAIGLNDVCDALRLHSGPLSARLRSGRQSEENRASRGARDGIAQVFRSLPRRS